MQRADLQQYLLSDRLLADADIITESAEAYFDLGIEALAGSIPEAADLARNMSAAPPDQVHRLLSSSALRCAVSELLAAHPAVRGDAASGNADAQGVLREGAALLDAPPRTGAALEGDVLPLEGPEGDEFRLWLPRTPGGAAQRLLTRQFERSVAVDAPARIVAGDGVDVSGHVGVLTAALRLLRAAAPELTASIGRHVHLISVVVPGGVSVRMLSASDSTIPGTLFLSVAALGDRLSAAEAVLHEGTHQRLYDLMLCRQLYAPRYSPQTSPRVTPPWYASESGGGKAWHADRVLAALHVYAHLAALWTAALGRDDVLFPEERQPVVARLRRCHTRGRYLLATLRRQMNPVLGPDGIRLVEFLARVFGDPSTGSRIGPQRIQELA
ncbi:aKG-HExxH-type peptide beta-hydroxylase [Streptacidiphilus neutrinimicus]|uniref:aKG-HExxH-type peptide beta-hydroxylase n=1 Tax=Streptacidiphilus neutrinimicus TaxID=105420 RepID=UPI0005A9458A|nr:HEXXH motif-containing putative peptide modification protein [Streptacidiphilus neutrinimicus]